MKRKGKKDKEKVKQRNNGRKNKGKGEGGGGNPLNLPKTGGEETQNGPAQTEDQALQRVRARSLMRDLRTK